jgi:hypothetical protein
MFRSGTKVCSPYVRVFKEKPLRIRCHAVLMLALIVFSTGAAQQSHPVQEKPNPQREPITEDLSHGAAFTFKIAPNLPEFTFKVIPDVQKPDQYGNPQTIIQEVLVFRGTSNEPLQSLDDCEWEGMEAPQRGSDWFRAVDLNFDGYRDIYVLTTWGATGNEYGCVWLYDPRSGRFDYSKEFSELSRFTLDPATKTITTHGNGGMAGMVYRAAKYVVQNNRPVLVMSESQDWDFDKKQFHCIVKQLRGSEMVTVRDVWGKPEDGTGPCDPSNPFHSVGNKTQGI